MTRVLKSLNKERINHWNVSRKPILLLHKNTFVINFNSFLRYLKWILRSQIHVSREIIFIYGIGKKREREKPFLFSATRIKKNETGTKDWICIIFVRVFFWIFWECLKVQNGKWGPLSFFFFFFIILEYTGPRFSLHKYRLLIFFLLLLFIYFLLYLL